MSMVMVMYTDLLMNIGYISEEWWDKWTWKHGNMVEIDIPKDLLKAYYLEKLQDQYNGISFWRWYSEESIADDMDGFFEWTEWRPFLADIVSWQ